VSLIRSRVDRWGTPVCAVIHGYSAKASPTGVWGVPHPRGAGGRPLEGYSVVGIGKVAEGHRTALPPETERLVDFAL
jgi:hypothetical protein